MKLKEIYVDGYKNLIDCRLELGDFNILVGPNNSGKSNFLETLRIFSSIFFSFEQTAKKTFSSNLEFLAELGFSELPLYKKRPVSFGVVFETFIDNEPWQIRYKVTLNKVPAMEKFMAAKVCFNEERLEAKSLARTGPWTKLLERKTDQLSVLTKTNKRKTHKIVTFVSSFWVLKSLYPEFENLHEYFIKILPSLISSGQIHMLSLSPDKLRDQLGHASVEGFSSSGFDLLLAIDRLVQKDKKLYDLFVTTFCNIMDFDNAYFRAEDIPAPSENGKKQDPLKRTRLFAIKHKGGDYSNIENYSDGTLVISALLVALISRDPENPILCVEEIENYLHPRAQERLLRFMQDHSERWPMLITTHSPYLINGVNPSDINVAVVDETGATHFEKITNRKALNERLKSSYISFGDLLVNNFQDVLGAK